MRARSHPVVVGDPAAVADNYGFIELAAVPRLQHGWVSRRPLMREHAAMYDEDKVAEMVLALLHLNAFRDGPIIRAWKGFDWDALDRLHERGYISDPKSKAKSVVLSADGVRRAQELFERHFGT
jgi:hypothetical protein